MDNLTPQYFQDIKTFNYIFRGLSMMIFTPFLGSLTSSEAFQTWSGKRTGDAAITIAGFGDIHLSTR